MKLVYSAGLAIGLIAMNLSLRRAIATCLLAAPLAVGAVMHTDMAATWSSTEEQVGAPAAGVDPSVYNEIRKSTGQAASQAAVLKSGIEKIADGTNGMTEKTNELIEGAKAAQEGSKALADGMVQIQAGTGQLGQGATEIADGIDAAAAQLAGLEGVRTQIIEALKEAETELKKSIDPRSNEMLSELENFRAQVENFAIDPAVLADFQRLQEGSRELANQLAVPGYAYHDGIYAATKGAQELADGLNALDGGVSEAVGSVEQLENGAAQLAAMAEQNQNNVAGIARQIPAAQVGSEEAEEAGVKSALPPLYAFLIAAGVLAASISIGRSRVLVVGAVAGVALIALAGVLVATLGTGVGIGAALAAAGIAAGLVVTAAATTMALVRVCGPTVGAVISIVGAAVQVGIVGWAWNAAVSGQVSTFQQVLSHLMPLHYPTSALSALGNGVAGSALWLGVGITAALAVAAAVSAWLVWPRDLDSSHPEARHLAGSV